MTDQRGAVPTAANRLDPRVARTQAALKQALVDLLQTVDYDQISVSRLVRHAGVSRAAYYLHYETKDALLLACLSELFEDFNSSIDVRGAPEELAHRMGIGLFRGIRHHRQLLRAVFAKAGQTVVLDHMRSFVVRVLQRFCAVRSPAPGQQTVELAADFLAGAVYAMAARWLDDDMPQRASQIGRVFGDLARSGIDAVLAGRCVGPR